MYMKQILIIAALALCGMTAFGQQKNLVVAPFENQGSGLDAAVLNNLQDYMINAFINTGRFQVPDRNALALLSAENKFQLSDWSGDNKSAEMGKVLNADYIVRVIIMHNGEVNVLSARILDVNTTKGLAAGEMEFTSQRDAHDKMDKFVGGIVARISARDPIAQPKPDPAPVPEPKQPPPSRYPGGFNFSTSGKVGYGYLNMLGGLGSFIMGDWAGGLMVGGLQVAGVTMMAIDFPQTTSHTTYNATFGRTTTTYEETGGGPAFYIGLVLELCGVIYGYFRPFKYDKPHAYYRASGKKPWQDNPLEHIGVVLLPDSKGVSVVNLSYNLSF